MLLSPLEQINQQIKTHQAKILRLEEKKKDLTKPLLLYDICLLWKSQSDHHHAQYSSYADLFLSPEDTLLTIHNFLDEVEETILADWHLNIQRTFQMPELQSYYYHKDNNEINIDFSNTQCRKEPTGRMIPEVKSICSLKE